MMGFLKSFICAFMGLRYALKNERNLRIHFCIAILVFAAGTALRFSYSDMVLLIITVSFVIVCEMINTAVEKTIDNFVGEYHQYARIAKDVAAGAVLVASLAAVLVALLLFCRAEVLERLTIMIGGLI